MTVTHSTLARLNLIKLAERGFDPRTSGLWAQHASTAPLCCLSGQRYYSKCSVVSLGSLSRFGLAAVSRTTETESVRIRFGSPFSSKIVVCGHCLVTLSLTVNETLKWLSSLPILMQESFWVVVTVSLATWGTISEASPPPPYPLPALL